MSIEDIIYELETRRGAYDLDGVEITQEDAEQVIEYMADGAPFEEAIDTLLDGIRYVISEGWEF